jgi:DNA-binding LacI/PurR family transcriptional regulator
MTRTDRPTLADVAAAAGVSVSTASLAFSGAGPVAAATRERVLASAAELGYTGPNPTARSLRRGRSGVIAVVVGSELRRAFSDPVLTQTLDGVAQELGARGLGLLLVRSDQFTDVPTLIRDGAMDAAIIAGLAEWSDPLLVALRARGVPVVRIDAGREDPGGVGIDDRSGMAEIGRYVRGLGHTRIGTLALPLGHRRQTRLIDAADPGPIAFTPSIHRWEGLRDAGVVPVRAAEAATSGVEEGMAAARLLLAGPDRPTAIIAFSDLLAAGAVIAAREVGLRVPQDVSIAGFDGIDLPWLAPDRLTSAAQPLIEKGRLTARAAAALVEGEPATYPSLPVTLSVGTTTGPPPD